MFYVKAAILDGSPEAAALARRSKNTLEMTPSMAYLSCAMKILGQDLGFNASADTELPQLGDGQPIPMWSYAVIEYLMGLDLSGYDVLELGSGQSTLFLSRRCKSVTAVENNSKWLDRLNNHQLTNVNAILTPRGGMPAVLAKMTGRFQFIAIDPGENRLACAQAAIARLDEFGMILLDNSEWYPNAAAFLRSEDLIQIDFHDFRPVHHYRTTTSLFLRSGFRPRPLAARLPAVPIGGRSSELNLWDQPQGITRS